MITSLDLYLPAIRRPSWSKARRRIGVGLMVTVGL